MNFFLLNFFWKLLSRLPLPVMYFFADILYYPFYYLVKYRRKITRKNLTESFPQKNITEIIRIEKKFYRYFLDIFFETCKMATISNKEMARRMKFINLEEFNISNSENKSISMYMAHFGNWEWVSSLNLYINNNVAGGQIYHRLRNKTFDRLMLQNRGRFGTENVEMKETLRWLNERLQKNIVTAVGYIADQSPKKKHAINFLFFLNHNVPVLVGTEKIVKKYDMDAFYLDINRVKRGYYEATIIKMHENPKLLSDFKLTEIYYKMLEESIKRQPEIYLWTHNRFKHAKKE